MSRWPVAGPSLDNGSFPGVSRPGCRVNHLRICRRGLRKSRAILYSSLPSWPLKVTFTLFHEAGWVPEPVWCLSKRENSLDLPGNPNTIPRCPSPQRVAVQQLYSKGPDPLFCDGSRASRTKISDIHNRLNYCVIFVVHTQFKNVDYGPLIWKAITQSNYVTATQSGQTSSFVLFSIHYYGERMKLTDTGSTHGRDPTRTEVLISL